MPINDIGHVCLKGCTWLFNLGIGNHYLLIARRFCFSFCQDNHAHLIWTITFVSWCENFLLFSRCVACLTCFTIFNYIPCDSKYLILYRHFGSLIGDGIGRIHLAAFFFLTNGDTDSLTWRFRIVFSIENHIRSMVIGYQEMCAWDVWCEDNLFSYFTYQFYSSNFLTKFWVNVGINVDDRYFCILRCISHRVNRLFTYKFSLVLGYNCFLKASLSINCKGVAFTL